MRYHHPAQSGFSLVEAVVVAALSLFIFGALFSSFQYTLQLVNNSRAKLSALSIANDRMEYFRSLPYADVGTISGIPAGTIPQTSTTSLNGIEFAERVLVEYVDDPADGQDTATTSDSNLIPADYKRIKVEYTWFIGNATSSLSLISNVVPRSIETTAGGGTARINVIGANSLPLPGASVRLLNNTTTTTIDVTRTTDASGAALFSGAPAAGNYEVFVTGNIAGNQYSTTQTYQATTSNPNPIVSPFAVLEADVSTLTFQIGELSDLDIITYTDILEGSMVEPFTDLLAVASSTDIEVSGGAAVLESTLGVYENSGIVFTEIIEPSVLEQWEVARVAVNVPVNTAHAVRFYTGTSTGPFTLIPDSELPGNSIGFTETIIDLSGLDAVTYDAITAGITLETIDTAVTPEVDEIAVFYRESATIRPSVSFDMHGEKSIGTDVSFNPIYKYTNSFSTDGSGEHNISDLEFDLYTIENTDGYDVASACPGDPYVHEAGVDAVAEYVLVANSANTARIIVEDSAGRAIPGASVNLTRPGYDTTILTNTCGQAHFTGGMSTSNDYQVTVIVAGYTDEIITAFGVDGDVQLTVTLLN